MDHRAKPTSMQYTKYIPEKRNKVRKENLCKDILGKCKQTNKQKATRYLGNVRVAGALGSSWEGMWGDCLFPPGFCEVGPITVEQIDQET